MEALLQYTHPQLDKDGAALFDDGTRVPLSENQSIALELAWRRHLAGYKD